MHRELQCRPQPVSFRRGDALKTVLIVMGILGGLMLLSCLGVGVAGYFWFQKNLANAAVTDPVKIRQMTADQTDIAIPAEFVPQTGSQLFGMNIVTYQWCPTGTCAAMGGDDESEFNAGTLTLTTFATDGQDDVDADEFWEESFAETNLNEQYRNHTKDVKEFTIRGKACKFFIVKGEEIPWDAVDADDPAMTETTTETPADPAAGPATTDPAATPASPTTDAAAPAAAPTAPAKPGRQIVWVQGVFPGKKGDCTLNLYLLGSDYDEAKILAMLQSIK